MIYQNGVIWRDTDGNPLHAHGGHMLYHNGYWYWYGEDRRNNIYVSCYRSADLEKWEFRNHVLTTDSKCEETRVRSDLNLRNEDNRISDGSGSGLAVSGRGKVNLERPKVLYNKKTGKFVLWAHYENGRDYHCAACAIATCDTPDGDFVYHGSFNPYGYMSRDCTLWQEEDGTAYFISASRDNADTHVYRLAEDYLNVEALVGSLWQGEYREAPAVMKKDGTYFMFSSYCTGWDPNQGKYAFSDSMEKAFSVLKNFGDETTFDSQPAFILPLDSSKGRQYLYVGDRWSGNEYFSSGYIFLLIRFDEAGMPYITWNERFELDSTNGYREL